MKQENIYLKFLLLPVLFFALCSPGFGQDTKGAHPQNNSGYPKCYFYVYCPYTTYLGAFYCYTPPAAPYTRDDLVKLGFKIGYPCYKLVIKTKDSYYKVCSKYDQTVIRTITVFDDRNYNGYFDYGETGVKCYLTYKLIADVTAPYIKCPDPLYVSCYKDIPAPDPSKVYATDNCGKVYVYFAYDKVVYDYGCKKTIWRYYKAVDYCGNVSYCYQVIYVEDKTPPYIKCPDPLYVSCYKDIPYPDVSKVYATDNCTAYPKVEFAYDKVVYNYGCKKTIWRYYKATDDCYNVSYCYQIIYVEDKTPPTIYCPDPIYVGCYDKIPYPNPYYVKAYDNCTAYPKVSFAYDKVVYYDGYCKKIIWRYYKAVDDCYNVSYCYQIIYVGYSQSDVITKAQSESSAEMSSGKQVAPQTSSTLGMKAYPNPFRDKVQFVITSTLSGNAKLEMFNMLGQKVATIWTGQMTAGKAQTVNYNAPPAHQTNLVYRLTVGDKVVTGKLLNIK